MRILALDIGSSSVKAAVLAGGRLLGRPVRSAFATCFEAGRAEVEPAGILRAIHKASVSLPRGGVDVVAIAGMAPSWVAMDAAGRPITPIVTHQDRRSRLEAQEFLREFGQEHLLTVTGNLPFPGGISCTTCRWFCRHAPEILKRTDLAGHVTTWLHRQVTGARVMDPSNASFTGLYETVSLGGWDQRLARFAGVSLAQLPEVRDGAEEGGRLTAAGARVFSLPRGTPVLTGIMDTSAALLAVGAKVGQLVNASGTTDVLAMCVNKPRPHAQLLTRAVGTGRLWVQVSTIASAGSTLQWLRETFFQDLKDEAFYRLVTRLTTRPPEGSTVRFDAYLAGDRMTLAQKQGAFSGLTLATTRQEMLYAAIDALANLSAARLPLLAQTGTRPRRDVLLTGGAGKVLSHILQRDWNGQWRFRQIAEANLHGLATLAAR